MQRRAHVGVRTAAPHLRTWACALRGRWALWPPCPYAIPHRDLHPKMCRFDHVTVYCQQANLTPRGALACSIASSASSARNSSRSSATPARWPSPLSSRWSCSSCSALPPPTMYATSPWWSSTKTTRPPPAACWTPTGRRTISRSPMWSPRKKQLRALIDNNTARAGIIIPPAMGERSTAGARPRWPLYWMARTPRSPPRPWPQPRSSARPSPPNSTWNAWIGAAWAMSCPQPSMYASRSGTTPACSAHST